MAALAATTPTRAGTVSAGAAVAASDTIAASIVGTKGCLLEIINGNASPDVMAITDAGSSPAGTPVTSYAATVTNATAKVFFISPKQVDSSAQTVTVTHSVTTTVTYKLYPLG